MKRNFTKLEKLSEEKGLRGLFYRSDVTEVVKRNNYLLCDSVFDALQLGAAIGYQAALKDAKEKAGCEE